MRVERASRVKASMKTSWKSLVRISNYTHYTLHCGSEREREREREKEKKCSERERMRESPLPPQRNCLFC